MTDDGRNTSLSGEIENAAASAVRSASSVSHSAKAAALALGGNLPGAAAEALKSKNVRRVIAVLLSFLILLSVFVMYILPVSLFSGAQAVVTQASDAFLSGYFSGSGGNLMKGALGFASSLLSSLWNTIRIGTGSFYSGDDMDIVSVSEAPVRSLYSKILATKEKYSVRFSEVLREVESAASETVYLKAYSEFQSVYDPSRDEFCGFTWDESSCVPEMSDLTALQLICLHAAVRGNDLSLTSLSDYLQWLGFEGSDRHHTVKVPGGTVSVKAWDGTFLPQYLEDESYYSGKDYKDRGVSAMDLMINVRVSPSLTDISTKHSERVVSLCGTYSSGEYSIISGKLEKYMDEKYGRVEEERFQTVEYRDVLHVRGQSNPYYYDGEKQEYYSSSHGGRKMPAVWQDTGTETLPFSDSFVKVEVFEYFYSVRYSAHITVCPGSIGLLSDLAGILSGSFFTQYSDYLAGNLDSIFAENPA